MGISTEVCDDDLLDDLRAGRNDAFGELYQRHHSAARRYARSLLRSEQDAEDAVAEAFTSILAAIRNDAGPQDGFRPYLLASVRNHCARRARQQVRGTAVADGDLPSPDNTGPERVVERHVVSAAFGRLDQRWRTLLWMTEVEQREPADVAARTGLDTTTIAAALYRAREGFAESYLAQHLERVPIESCARYAPKYVRYVRGTAGGMTRRQVDAHLERCTSCAAAVRDLEDVNEALRGQLVPALLVAATMSGGGPAGVAVLAGGAAAGWLAKVAVIAAAAITLPVALTADVERPAAAAEAAAERPTSPLRPGGGDAAVTPTMSASLQRPVAEAAPAGAPHTTIAAHPLDAALTARSPAAAIAPAAPTGAAAVAAAAGTVGTPAAQVGGGTDPPAPLLPGAIETMWSAAPVASGPAVSDLPGLPLPGLSLPGASVPSLELTGELLPNTSSPAAALEVVLAPAAGSPAQVSLSADVGPIDVGPIDVGPVDVGPIDMGPIDMGPIEVGESSPVAAPSVAAPTGTAPTGTAPATTDCPVSILVLTLCG